MHIRMGREILYDFVLVYINILKRKISSTGPCINKTQSSTKLQIFLYYHCFTFLPSGALLTCSCQLTFKIKYKIQNIIFHTFIQYVVLDEEIEIPCQQTTQHCCAIFEALSNLGVFLTVQLWYLFNVLRSNSWYCPVKPESFNIIWISVVHMYTVYCTDTWWVQLPKPNSWMYNFVEVSGHNLENSQAWGCCMDFLNHRKEGTVFYQVFLLSSLQCTVQ